MATRRAAMLCDLTLANLKVQGEVPGMHVASQPFFRHGQGQVLSDFRSDQRGTSNVGCISCGVPGLETSVLPEESAPDSA